MVRAIGNIYTFKLWLFLVLDPLMAVLTNTKVKLVLYLLDSNALTI